MPTTARIRTVRRLPLASSKSAGPSATEVPWKGKLDSLMSVSWSVGRGGRRRGGGGGGAGDRNRCPCRNCSGRREEHATLDLQLQGTRSRVRGGGRGVLQGEPGHEERALECLDLVEELLRLEVAAARLDRDRHLV